MKKILAVSLGGLAGYCVWKINALGFAGAAVDLVAIPMIHSTSEWLSNTLGSPHAAMKTMTEAILILHALPAAIAVGTASALFLIKVPHRRLFFYSVLCWPIVQICLNILMLTVVTEGSARAGIPQLAESMYSLVDDNQHKLFILFSVYYIAAFLLLALFTRIRKQAGQSS